MTKDDKWSQELGHLLKVEKEGGYVDYIRDRWSDADVLKVFWHARKLEKRRLMRKAKVFRFKKDDKYDGDEAFIHHIEEKMLDNGKPGDFPRFTKDWKLTILIEEER